MAKEVYIKLKDSSSIFSDIKSGTTVTGKRVVKVGRSDRVKEGLRGGAIIEVEKSEYDSANKEAETAKKAQKEKSENPVPEIDTEGSEYHDWTNKELKTELDKRGITYDSDDIKKDFVARLAAADSNDAANPLNGAGDGGDQE